jgi:hypothetical protein
MAFIANSVLDSGLSVLSDDGNRIDICSEEPATYTAATATVTLGNKTSLSIGAPTDRTPDGRKVVVAAVSDGTVTATGTATHYAIVDTVGEVLLATGSIITPQTVTSGNTFTLAAFDIGIPGAV